MNGERRFVKDGSDARSPTLALRKVSVAAT